jgi:regulator of telomere elongation helicase 1
VCPYYLAREDQEEAELTVLPYNYLFDASMRRAQKIDITNAIVIVDEAHNLEKHAEETASFDLTPIILANCIDDVSTPPPLLSGHLFLCAFWCFLLLPTHQRI